MVTETEKYSNFFPRKRVPLSKDGQNIEWDRNGEKIKTASVKWRAEQEKRINMAEFILETENGKLV